MISDDNIRHLADLAERLGCVGKTNKPRALELLREIRRLAERLENDARDDR
jgi:hypothetical protein